MSDETQTVSVRSSVFTGPESTGPQTEEFGPPPELSDRYRVVGGLGRGGVGVVYRGWDEELARPVAIKFLRPDRSNKYKDRPQDLASRLRRESMALAALSHPNVVAVYDVVEGKGGVGIVMELIEGKDLRSWQRKKDRPTRDILEVFVQAGRGLEAAHAEGFVHRDFKPGNVMVGYDGRVRVLDFGLARLVAAHPSGTSRLSGKHIVIAQATDSGGFHTDFGTVMGTPAYMAPEQIDGEHLDARSDQFSYCVSLFEALTGERPFEGISLRKRREAIEDGPPPLPTVSRRLQAAIAKGLSADPDDRHPSMRELIDELETELRPTSKIGWIAGVGLVGVSAAILLGLAEDEDEPCAAADPRVVSWTDERRDAIEAAFMAIDAPFAEDAWTKSASTLDDYVERWSRERDLVCGADDVETNRVQCLANVRNRFDAVLAILDTADAGVAEHALDAMFRLPDPSLCEATPQRNLEDPELSAIYARAVALSDAGQYQASLESSRDLLQRAIAKGNTTYEAVGLFLIGSAKDELGEYEDALGFLEDGYFVALRDGSIRTAAEAALDASAAAGMGMRRTEEGLRWLRHARTQLVRLENSEAELARAKVIEAGIMMLVGQRDAGLKLLEEAHATFVETLGEENSETINVLNNLGLAYQEIGRLDEALVKHERARELFTEIMGPEHPSVVNVDHAIAATLGAMGRWDESVKTYRRVIAKWEKTFPPGHPRVAMAHYNVGLILQQAEKYDESLDVYTRALALIEAALGPDHINTAMAVHNIGSVHHELKEHEKAQTYLERSLAIFESAEVNPLYLAINRMELAMVLHEQDLEPDRVTMLIKSSKEDLANGGAFSQQEYEGILEWIQDNRPDLVGDEKVPGAQDG